MQNEYAARVHDPRTYHSICRDIVTRWVYPLVPDSPTLQDTGASGLSGYTHLRRYVYKEQGVKVSRTAHVGESVVLGRGSVIEANAQVLRSVLGRGCWVGAGATVQDSHLWTGAVMPVSSAVSVVRLL